MRGLLLESGNDAAVTLAAGRVGLAKAFVREMNRRARKLGLDAHPLRQPDRPRRAGQLLQRARPRDARHRPAHELVLQEDRRLAVGHGRRLRQDATERGRTGTFPDPAQLTFEHLAAPALVLGPVPVVTPSIVVLSLSAIACAIPLPLRLPVAATTPAISTPMSRIRPTYSTAPCLAFPHQRHVRTRHPPGR